MNKYFLVLIAFVMTMPVWADANIRLEFTSSTVKMGEIIHVQMSLDPASAQSLPVQSLKGQTLSESLYIQSVSPMLKHEGNQDYSSDAEIIFIKVPSSNELIGNFNNQKVRFYWNNVRVDSLEAPAEFFFGSFDIPSPMRILLWILSAAGILGAVIGIWKLRTYLDKKSSRKKELRDLKDKIQTCRKYEDVVAIWKLKRVFLERFPHLEGPFTKFESVLFKYQFKPTQTFDEQAIVMDAYRVFISETEGGFNGI